MVWHRLLRLAGLAGLSAANPVTAAADDTTAAFIAAFQPGYAIKVNEAQAGEAQRIVETKFRLIEMGDLIVTSGRIAAADPFVGLTDTPPFIQAVPNGRFPVTLSVAEVGPEHFRVALARVKFSDAPVVRWTMAVVPGQDVATLKPGEHFGYPVDAGTGSFFDPEAAKAAAALYKANEDVWEDWQRDGEANGERIVGTGSYILMLPLGAHNAAMFHSGWGDGLYASWFGLDAKGDAAQLVTDFNVVDWAAAVR